MLNIEKDNPDLKDVLPKIYNKFSNSLLIELIRLMDKIPIDIEGDAFDSTVGSHTMGGSALCDMDANDTAIVRTYNNLGTTTHDIAGDTSQMTTYLTGFLAC